MKGLWDEPVEKHAAPASTSVLASVRLGTRVCVLPGIAVHHAKNEQGVDLSVIQLNDGATESQRDAFHRIIRWGSYGGLTVEQADDKAIIASPTFAGTLGHLPSLGWRLQKRLEVFEQIAAIVASLHAERIAVGSLDPNYILLDDGLLPVVLGPALVNEFGPYTAPETIEKGIIDQRSDVYSLGRLLHFIVAQQVPPIEHADPARLEDLVTYPAGLSRIVRKAVLRASTARYPTVQALLNDIGKYGRYEEVGLAHKEVQEQNLGGMSLRPDPLPVVKKAQTKAPSRTPKGPISVRNATAKGKGKDLTAFEFTPQMRKALLIGGPIAVALALAGAYFLGSSMILRAIVSLGAGSFMFAVFSHGMEREMAMRTIFGVFTASILFSYSPEELLATIGGRMDLKKADVGARAEAVKKLNQEGKTDFKRIDLSNADLQEFDIMFGNFTDANLENADLRKAKLVMSNFTSARFRGAKLQGASLTGSTTDGVIGFEEAECDGFTQLPTNWTCVEDHPVSANGPSDSALEMEAEAPAAPAPSAKPAAAPAPVAPAPAPTAAPAAAPAAPVTP